MPRDFCRTSPDRFLLFTSALAMHGVTSMAGVRAEAKGASFPRLAFRNVLLSQGRPHSEKRDCHDRWCHVSGDLPRSRLNSARSISARSQKRLRSKDRHPRQLQCCCFRSWCARPKVRASCSLNIQTLAAYMRSRRVTIFFVTSRVSMSTADRVGWDVWVGSSVDERTNSHAISMRLEIQLPQGQSVGCHSRGSLRRISSGLLHSSNSYCRAPRYARVGLGSGVCLMCI
jgi:hypothetical protein